MTKKTKTRVFLSYAHEDLDMVRKIDSGLSARNLDVWFDKRCLKPGSWKRQIEKAIPRCRFFIICISDAALRKTGDEPGFQDEELQQAYEIARLQSEHFFSIVPVRIENCNRGDHRLAPWQQYDLFNNFEFELDHLAMHLGGISLADDLAKDIRSAEDKTLDSQIDKAGSLYFAGDYSKAIDIVNSVLILKPEFAGAWHKKGDILFARGSHEEAIKAYEKAIQIKTEFAEAWHNKGVALSVLGRYEEAVMAYSKALMMEPDVAEGWYNKSVALNALGRCEEAFMACDQALQIESDFAEAWYGKGIILFARGSHEEAIKAYGKALQIKPEFAEAWYNKGVILSGLGRKKEALIALKKALRFFKEIKSPRAELARNTLANLTIEPE